MHVGNGGETVKIAVADEGPGIPRDEQERIFERFYRLDPAMASGVGGTGLGLYIARRLVEQMGGRLWSARSPATGRRSRPSCRGRSCVFLLENPCNS